jgi:DDE superfamily endonuclease
MKDITSEQIEMRVAVWQQVREQIYGCLKPAGDALFNLADALLSESQATSLAEWSLSPSFERKWPSVYEGLEDGSIDVDKLRAVWVAALLAEKGEDELIWMAVDSSVIERPDAQTSEDRGIIHLSNLPLVSKPIGVGWTVSSVVLLASVPCSWVPILDVQRVRTEQTPIQVAIAQLQALKPLLGKRRVILLADRGYCTPQFLRACRKLGISVIVRMKSDRKLYRPPVRRHKKGPMPKDGPLFQGKRQETHGAPEAEACELDAKGRAVRTSRWSDLHFKEDRDLTVKVIRVEREAAKDTKRDPRISWFVMLDEVVPLEAVASSYRLRFSQEHGYRFLKGDLLWTAVRVRTPEQFERWSWLVAIVFNQLYLARALGAALYRPWECQERPVTPGQVRRMMPTLLSQLGTPARPCQPRGKAPGRVAGFHPKPAQRYPVIVKNPKKQKTPKKSPQATA